MLVGANFASSPARILIDILDPLIVAKEVATTEDKGPDTADANIYGLLTIILVSGLGLGYGIRKRMN